MTAAQKLRLGIDVGGTFTDVVAVDAATRRLVASIKVPTTHDAPEGVAGGIIEGVQRLLARTSVRSDDVAFIAHSTTQATNALLEGDVAAVGVVGLVNTNAWIARPQMRIAPMPLAPGTLFAPQTVFARVGDRRNVQSAIDALAAAGVTAVATTQAFGVDHPRDEEHAAAYARELGLPATSGHDVSSAYGLRARTRTVALNAAILPTMLRTAHMTAQAVAKASIAAPLMIMRSDGGVMDVREVERRPIMTLLSGPAAGVAGALLYENVTDGIFIEVGGTSSDCSAIRAGMPQMRSARVGGHRTMLRTLDVRTLPIGGGSMARIGGKSIIDAGPRSAHIAGCAYAAFSDAESLVGAQVELIAPLARDPADYAVLVTRDGTRVALTPTCASNFLGIVPQDAFAHGSAASVQRAFATLGEYLGVEPERLATQLLDAATDRLLAAIAELVVDYALDSQALLVVGGGGAASALVPYAAKRGGYDCVIARDAEVISPIGVALALVRDVVERTIVNPTPQDILRLRAEAADRVIAAGAAPDRVEVAIEIDAQRNRVRATASGATAMVESAAGEPLDAQALREAATKSLRATAVDRVERVGGTGVLSVFELRRSLPRRWGKSRERRDLRVVDERGVVRLGACDALVSVATVARAESALREAIESATSFGDVGRALPDVYVLHGGRIADFSGLASADQAIALAKEELAGRDGADEIVILTAPKEP